VIKYNLFIFLHNIQNQKRDRIVFNKNIFCPNNND